MMVLRCKSPEWIAYFHIHVMHLIYLQFEMYIFSQIVYNLHVHELFHFDILKKTYLILESIRFFPIYIDLGGLFFTMH